MGDQKRTVVSLLYETLTRETFRKMEKFYPDFGVKKTEEPERYVFPGRQRALHRYWSNSYFILNLFAYSRS